MCSTYEGHPVPCLASFMLVTLLIHMPLSTDIPRISLIKTVTCVRNVTPRYIHKTTWAFRYCSTKTQLTSTVKNYLLFMQKMNRKNKNFSLSLDHLGRLREPFGLQINLLGALSEEERGRGVNGPWCEVDHSRQSSARVGNAWRCTSILAAFIQRCLVKHEDRFTAIAIKLLSQFTCMTKTLNAHISCDGQAIMWLKL